MYTHYWRVFGGMVFLFTSFTGGYFILHVDLNDDKAAGSWWISSLSSHTLCYKYNEGQNPTHHILLHFLVPVPHVSL